MNLAKGLGSGFPIGACVANGKAADLFGPGNHGSTFGGNPLGSRVASTVLDIIEQQSLAENAARQGQRLIDGFKASLGDLAGVKNIRGKGLMVGIELEKPCTDLVKQALQQEQLLINVTAASVIRLLPPLIITDEQTDEIIDKVSRLIRAFL
jgi:acetylornithine aminotransferase